MSEEQLKLEPGKKITIPLWDILSTSVSQISCLAFAGRNVTYNQELVVEMTNFTRNIQKIGHDVDEFTGLDCKFDYKTIFVR